MGVDPAHQTRFPLAFPSGSQAMFPGCGRVAYAPPRPEVPGSSLLHSAFMWVGDVLGNVICRKMCGPLDIRESMQFYDHSHGDPVNLEI